MKPPETSIIVPVVSLQINLTVTVRMKPRIPANRPWNSTWKALAVWPFVIAAKPRPHPDATAPIMSEADLFSANDSSISFLEID
jgi:hypothetical protein